MCRGVYRLMGHWSLLVLIVAGFETEDIVAAKSSPPVDRLSNGMGRSNGRMIGSISDYLR